jgi:hypothetical protein
MTIGRRLSSPGSVEWDCLSGGDGLADEDKAVVYLNAIASQRIESGHRDRVACPEVETRMMPGAPDLTILDQAFIERAA